MATELRTLIASIGAQEQARNAGLSLLRDNPEIDDDEFDDARAEHQRWLKSATHIRNKARERMNQIKPDAQKIIDDHTRDRQSLVILAKRIWLWQQGREHKLDEALDFTISRSEDHRITLRDLVEKIAETDEVTP